MSAFTDMLKRELRLGERELFGLIATAPKRYKVYYIPKRTGGWREIAHPASELKAAQRIIVEKVLKNLPIHPCATAYFPGASIRLNALRHAHNRAILKLDFKDFFPSITEYAWLSYCEAHDVFNRSDALIAARLLFRRPNGSKVLRLSIGAPSSPILSNVLLNEFDRQVHEKVSAHKIVYTRYADDMTFSAEKTWNLREVEPIIRSAIAKVRHPRLVINEKKTSLVTPKFRRQVTGVVITNDKRLSVGKDKKRLIRSMLHHYKKGEMNVVQAVKLSGQLAFVRDIEPDFYTRMVLYYGRDLFESLEKEVVGYRRPRPLSSSRSIPL